MANDELCRKCSFKESEHELSRKDLGLKKGQRGPCRVFVSEIKHSRDCPTRDANWTSGSCGGRCKELRKHVDETRERRSRYINHSIWLVTNRGVIDIGS